MPRFLLPVLVAALAALLACSDGAEPPVNNSSHDLQDDEPAQPDDDDDDGGCADHGECPVGLYCAFSDGVCGASDGFCRELDTTCPELVEPICGCDGLTYDNACRAGMVGVSVAQLGACGGTTTGEPPPPVPGCGGVECDDSEYCEWADGSCGDLGGAGGACVPIGGPCTGKSEPVCGCDGQTYGTHCDAKMFGVGIRHLGPC